MALIELIMPKMGESIYEATILNWTKKIGDQVAEEEIILEVATDKVDSEIPSPCSGVLKKIFFHKDAIIKIGQAIALIETEVDKESESEDIIKEHSEALIENDVETMVESQLNNEIINPKYVINEQSSNYISPLVRNIALKESISSNELDGLVGSGKGGRITKRDILGYVAQKNSSKIISSKDITNRPLAVNQSTRISVVDSSDEIIEMTRMRKMIADNMVNSKRVAPHVSSFVEADVTDLVNWRNANKSAFLEKNGTKITFVPFFIMAVAKAIQQFPMINVSVKDNSILVKKNINIGMATAMNSGNLIVPVIKNAEQLNIIGLSKVVNDLAARARIGKLKAEEIKGGTFTISNLGTFDNILGTPIILQPQVAILATGAIKKKPGVVETDFGDLIAIRHKMYLSLSYDHRVVDGALGGAFLKAIAVNLESYIPIK